MKFENFLLETFGLIYPGAIVYAINLHYPLAPLFPGLSEQDNLIRTCFVASGIYCIARIYCGISFLITSKIPHKLSERIMNYVVVAALFAAPFFHSSIQQILKKLYDDNAADLVNVLYDSTKEDIEKSYQFGLRILGLIFGWFVLLFAGELVLRVVIIILHYIFSSLWAIIFPTKRIVKIVKKTTESGEKDEKRADTADAVQSKKNVVCEDGVCKLVY